MAIRPRGDFALAVVVGCGLGWVGLAGVSLAQTPLQAPPAELSAPKPLAAPGTEAKSPSNSETPGAKPDAADDPGAIKVDTLGVLDPNSVGLLDAKAGGLGIDMWKGTGASLVSEFMARLPAPPGLEAARVLVRRVLLSASRPPETKEKENQNGEDGDAKGKAEKPKTGLSLVALRVNRLLALGDLESAAALLRVVPGRIAEPAIALARRDTAFLLNDNAGACAETQARILQFQDSSWRKSLVFCQLLAGKGPAASIGASLLREQGVEDEAFFTLVRILGGEKNLTFTTPERPEPLHLAMMRAGRIQIPDSVVEKGSAAMLRSVAFSPNASLDSRLDAAERAEAFGAIKAPDLARLYVSINFAPSDITGALTRADKLSGPRARALLYHAAQTQTVAAARAEIIAKAFTLARAQGRTGTAVRVFMPVLKQVDPSDDLAWFAREAGAALYLMGETDSAATWFELAVSEPLAAARQGSDGKKKSSIPPVPADVALWPLSVLAAVPLTSRPIPVSGEGDGSLQQTETEAGAQEGGFGSTDPVADAGPVQELDVKRFERWWKSASALGESDRRRRATLFLTLAQSLGIKVPGAAWLRVAGAGRETAALVTPGLLGALDDAARAGRLGETVLLAALALGEEAPGRLHPGIVAPVVRALIAAGFGGEARALAVETAFGAELAL